MPTKPIGHSFVIAQEKKKKAHDTAERQKLEELIASRILSVAKLRFNGNATELARALRVPYHRITHITKGDQRPSVDLIYRCVSELGITLEYLFGIVDQPYLSTKAVMLRVYPTDNPKRPCDKFEITGQLIGIGDYLKPESEYRAYRVMDDTNAPLIPPQSTVIVDRDWPPNDLSGLWAVSQAGEIQIRELVINNIRKTTELRCYNPAHKAVLVQSGDIDIIGRVIWHCQRH